MKELWQIIVENNNTQSEVYLDNKDCVDSYVNWVQDDKNIAGEVIFRGKVVEVNHFVSE